MNFLNIFLILISKQIIEVFEVTLNIINQLILLSSDFSESDIA